MEKTTVLMLVFTGLLIFSNCKKSIDNTGNVQTDPVITPIGTAQGQPVSKKIGKNGGSVISSDGMAELIFPDGALDADTDIVIQPITNNIPNGVNKAYRFMPDGLTFLKPVELKFHYTEQNLAATLPDLMGIGFQDSVGGWWRVNNFTNDAVNRIISAPIMHFSDWAEFDMLIINPAEASIGMNKSMNVEVDIVNSPDELMSLDPRSFAEIAPLQKVTAAPIVWSVNGVQNGNADFGTISPVSPAVASFKAPAKVPAQNPVAVSGVVDVKFTYQGKIFDKTSLTSNITITGEKYLLEIVEKRDDLQLGVWVTDSASMEVEMGTDSVTITNIKNNTPSVGNPANVSVSGCTFSYVPENTGRINITTARGEMRIQSPTQRAVQFFFVHTGTVGYSYRQFCPVPAGPPFDVTTPNESIDGDPITLFFDLTDSVVHDNSSTSSIIINAKLTLQKE